MFYPRFDLPTLASYGKTKQKIIDIFTLTRKRFLMIAMTNVWDIMKLESPATKQAGDFFGPNSKG
jgi:hypothetical protein